MVYQSWESWILLGSHAVTHQLTSDPALNLVTALATFDIGQFLANNVVIMETNADMLPTFPTKKPGKNFALALIKGVEIFPFSSCV